MEILAPSTSAREITERLADFFNSGTRLAWIIHLREELIEVCLSPITRKILGPGADLEGENLLPGFRYPIADLFTEWDWE